MKLWTLPTSTTRTIMMTLIIVSGSSLTASAGWNEFWFKIRKGYHRSNAWPQPFVEQDVHDTISPFETMKQNGWMLHNTISHDLFREGDGALLASGSERIRWITNHAPDNRRQIYVLKGRTNVETNARIASVRQSVESFRGDSPAPEILVSTHEPGYSSGAAAVAVSRAWLNATPTPALPSTSASGTQGVASGN